jgi:hypothetical protein
VGKDLKKVIEPLWAQLEEEDWGASYVTVRTYIIAPL